MGYSQQPSGHLADVPTGLFYPFFPEKVTGGEDGQASGDASDNSGGTGVGPGDGGGQGNYDSLLATAAASQQIPYGYHSSHDNFMLEEKDPVAVVPGMQMWMSNPGPVSPTCALRG